MSNKDIDDILYKAITEPVSTGGVSTADIRVGMLSSTDVQQIIHKAKSQILSKYISKAKVEKATKPASTMPNKEIREEYPSASDYIAGYQNGQKDKAKEIRKALNLKQKENK